MSFHKLEKCVSNPTRLQGLKYKQQILVSDSKVFTLKKIIMGNFLLNFGVSMVPQLSHY